MCVWDDLYFATEIAASFNYCVLGVAPLYMDPDNITPESVETDPEEVFRSGEALHFPKAYFCEVRADWKFMKDLFSSSYGFTSIPNFKL